MQLKTKIFMPLVVILLMGTMTTAFAQLTCSVSSTPVSRATRTGHTEPAGDLTFTCSEGAIATDAATVTVDFNAPITNSIGYPVGGEVSITNETGVFGPPGSDVAEVDSINHVTGQIVITLDATAPDGIGTSSFTLTNVLVSLVDVTSANLRASVSVSPGDNISIVANQDEATVISSIREGLADVEIGEGPARWLATGAPVTAADAGFTVDVTENYIDMFRNEADAPNGASNGVMLEFQFSGIPDGAELTCQAVVNGGTSVNVPMDLSSDIGEDPDPVGFGATATVDADDSTIWAMFVAPTDLAAIETATLDCGELDLAAPAGPDTAGFELGDADLPLTGNITVRVTLAPTGGALDDLTNADPTDDVRIASESGFIPRYEEVLTDALTVLSFTPATTTMIVPLAMGTPVSPAPFGSYDTGIAIANTTRDPFTDDEGGAFEQSGGVTFYFHPNTGDPFTVTPAQLAGSCGTNAAGAVEAGRTFLCNVSEILREGGQTAAFTGYLFIVADFTNAHGTAFIYGGTPQERFTSATDILVIRPPAVFPRIDNPEPTWK
jgi:hypothetical protein